MQWNADGGFIFQQLYSRLILFFENFSGSKSQISCDGIYLEFLIFAS
ncbi:hypothetical protein LEP1GSC008_3140 [Leptospira kirschneri serovar Bulgarica str. Nikolaevo]|uniref:Uncharacterized protein n=1 Tax=Leptospira kirschneri serovar Bulgarica str. Nikolaevo TaxID=1240687 RepID=M6FFU8_9LEPT|nr:hypothetical protein LEP1GSC008_3140 [Leptospira kirschneri serovar Bulgarica str. Nikolaevo]